MRHVYHHIGDVDAMNASLFRALKPGGRLAVVDFAPTAGVSSPAGRRDDGDRHGVIPDTVIDTLKAASFTAVEQASWSSSGYFLIVAQRPQATHRFSVVRNRNVSLSESLDEPPSKGDTE